MRKGFLNKTQLIISLFSILGQNVASFRKCREKLINILLLLELPYKL